MSFLVLAVPALRAFASFIQQVTGALRTPAEVVPAFQALGANGGEGTEGLGVDLIDGGWIRASTPPADC